MLTYDQKNLGWLKPSHDGRYIVEVTAGGQLYSALELHRFNNTTGMIYDGIQVLDQADKFIYLYSIEWSPDQSKIYVTGYNSASGYDLFQLEINQFDKTKIRNSLTNIAATQSNIGSPILGADNKIYITNWGSKSEFLHVIHKPNLSGINCDFRYFDFSLGSKTSLGAPLYASGLQFPYRAYIQGEQFICHDTTVRYILTDPCSHPETQWSVFDGAKIIRHNEDTIDVYFRSSGTYRISATYPTECGFKSDTIEVKYKNATSPSLITAFLAMRQMSGILARMVSSGLMILQRSLLVLQMMFVKYNQVYVIGLATYYYTVMEIIFIINFMRELLIFVIIADQVAQCS
ncbi:MAG: hypothetical protein IPL25_03780 [Saprospiraceae bacterium]|nr:hypothetical protein [Candidatus Vicinibacter affinis]